MIVRESSIGPLELCRLLWHALPRFLDGLHEARPEWPSASAFFSPFRAATSLYRETAAVVALAIVLTAIRYALQSASQVWIARWRVAPKYKHKLPECIWKGSYYSVAWLLALYVHMYRVDSFSDPMSMWDGWAPARRVDAPPPYDTWVLAIYLLQTAFYVHSVYATLFMDMWRADSWIMFTHHFVAIALLMISYVENYTLAGAFVLLLQDNSDVALEITKLCVYLKRREDGRYYAWLERAGNAVLYGFGVMWIVFRLYWFTTKLLYGAVYGGCVMGPRDSLAFPILGAMLLSILLLNLFWFNFIARMIVRVWRTGAEPEDNREYDTTTGAPRPRRPKRE